MRVNEIFESIQGEGPDVGRRAVFVRLGGCNRRCGMQKTFVRGCDTQYAWHHWVEVEVDKVVDAVRRYRGVGLVVITGGEPMMQSKEVYELSEKLRMLGYEVVLETNGDFMVDVRAFDRVIVSPKDVVTLRKWLGRGDVVIKVVVHEDNVDEVMEECSGVRGVYFMPEGVTPLEIIERSRMIMEKMKEYQVDGYVAMRAHVMLGLR